MRCQVVPIVPLVTPNGINTVNSESKAEVTLKRHFSLEVTSPYSLPPNSLPSSEKIYMEKTVFSPAPQCHPLLPPPTSVGLSSGRRGGQKTLPNPTSFWGWSPTQTLLPSGVRPSKLLLWRIGPCPNPSSFWGGPCTSPSFLKVDPL